MCRTVLLAALLCGGIAAQKTDSLKKTDLLAGTYANGVVKLELRHTKGKQYGGILYFRGHTYPVAARSDRETLNGAFTDEGKTFPFTAKQQPGGLQFVTGGVTYDLKQQEPVNPLAPPAQTSAPVTKQPDRLHRNASGAAFIVPEGWTVHDAPEASALMPPRDPPNAANPEELYVVAAHEGFSGPDDPALIARLRQDLASTGLFFDRAGEKETYLADGRSITVLTWELQNPTPMMIRIFLTSSSDRVLSLAAIAARDRVLGWDPQLRRIAAGMKYEPAPGAAPPAILPDPVQQWTARLTGSVLTQTNDSAGIATRKTLRLAPGGSFQYEGSTDDGVRQSASGNWRIVADGGRTLLELAFSDGKTHALPLASQGGDVFVDGVRTLVDRKP